MEERGWLKKTEACSCDTDLVDRRCVKMTIRGWSADKPC